MIIHIFFLLLYNPKKRYYQFAILKLLEFLFLIQTFSLSNYLLSQAQCNALLSFAPPITIKSVTLFVSLTLASVTSDFLLAGNICFLWIYFLLVNHDPISQHVSVL